MFHGSMVALITPMKVSGELDEEKLRNLVEFHIAEGSDAIVAVGTTGESATLTDAEQARVIRMVVDQVKGRIPVIAGSGANSTAKAIALTHNAMETGVDACLVVTPYYNKPTQEGLYQHYKTIASNVAVPIIMYNVPGRTSVDMLAETVARLAHVANIVGIKEATGQVQRTDEIIKLCNSSLDIFSGDDLTALELMQHGAKGAISVTANVAPKLMHQLCAAALKGDNKQATIINEKLMPLHKSLFLESNPIPAKWALYKMGMVLPGIRLPLTRLAEHYQPMLIEAMQKAGIEV